MTKPRPEDAICGQPLGGVIRTDDDARHFIRANLPGATHPAPVDTMIIKCRGAWGHDAVEVPHLWTGTLEDGDAEVTILWRRP